MKLLFPDACWRPELISGAIFLYFQDDKIWLTLNPSVSTFLTGTDPFDFMCFVQTRMPEWSPKFFKFVHLWQTYRSSFQETYDLLRPLHNVGFQSMLLSYPRGTVGWQRSEELIASSNMEPPEVEQVIDPFSAADELFSHIFFEKYLELYEAHRGPAGMFALGAEEAREGSGVQSVKVDWTLLYQYCDQRFRTDSLAKLLATSYMFRMCAFRTDMELVVTNPRLIRFLASLPLSLRMHGEKTADDTSLDVVAWEFFRQLVSPHVDPVDTKAVEKIGQLIQDRSTEIRALKRKCLKLGQDFGEDIGLEQLESRISQHIRANVEAEVQAVVSLDKKAVREFLDFVFYDDKTWIGIAAFIYSLVNGGVSLTAGAAIFALSSLGSKAVKAAAAKREKLEVSDYALLYRLRQ